MRNYFHTFSIFFLILVIAAPAAAFADAFSCLENDQKPQMQTGLLAKVEQRYKDITQLQARFIQVSYFVAMDISRKSAGEVFFQKPGKMDWMYKDPEIQRFVADGNTLWYYQPDLKQVTVGDFRASFQSELPVSFLLGIGSLTKQFSSQTSCRSTEGLVLKLQPKTGDESLEQFWLLIDAVTFEPFGARVIDAGGNETTIILRDINYTAKLDKSRFEFQVPKDVDVIDQRSRGQLSVPAAKSVAESDLISNQSDSR